MLWCLGHGRLRLLSAKCVSSTNNGVLVPETAPKRQNTGGDGTTLAFPQKLSAPQIVLRRWTHWEIEKHSQPVWSGLQFLFSGPLKACINGPNVCGATNVFEDICASKCLRRHLCRQKNVASTSPLLLSLKQRTFHQKTAKQHRRKQVRTWSLRSTQIHVLI